MMECNWNTSSLPWLAKDEQDFPLGAKDASYLPSATNVEYGISDLPDWMESRDILVQPSDVLSINPSPFDEQMEIDSSSQGFGGYLDTGEDYGVTINPDDMLVPLSELQPEKYAPQGNICQTTAPTSAIPKISVRVSKVKIPKSSFDQSGFQNSVDVNTLQSYNSASFQSSGSVHSAGDLQNYSTDELLNELVYLSSTKPNLLTNLMETLDSSVVQAGMEDLLSQLEENDFKNEVQVGENDFRNEVQGPQSPVSIPSPVPSAGSLSPQSTSDYSFHQMLSPVYYNEVTTSSENVKVVSSHSHTVCEGVASPSQTDYNSSVSSYGEDSLLAASPAVEDNLSVSSPVYKEDELYVSSPSALEYEDDEETMSDYNKKDMHSYTRSPRKKKSSRKSSSSSAYPESRKERKKEQNKQAALRYRQKKKQEDDVLMAQIHAEEERQKKLKARYSNLKQELSCLKKIMREVLIAKGTISPDAFKKK